MAISRYVLLLCQMFMVRFCLFVCVCVVFVLFSLV